MLRKAEARAEVTLARTRLWITTIRGSHHKTPPGVLLSGNEYVSASVLAITDLPQPKRDNPQVVQPNTGAIRNVDSKISTQLDTSRGVFPNSRAKGQCHEVSSLDDDSSRQRLDVWR